MNFFCRPLGSFLVVLMPGISCVPCLHHREYSTPNQKRRGSTTYVLFPSRPREVISHPMDQVILVASSVHHERLKDCKHAWLSTNRVVCNQDRAKSPSAESPHDCGWMTATRKSSMVPGCCLHVKKTTEPVDLCFQLSAKIQFFRSAAHETRFDSKFVLSS